MLNTIPLTFGPPVLFAPVNAVMLEPDRSVPQRAGTTITWTATPRGGRGPYEYKWLLYNGYEWDVVKGWSGSNTLRWTPPYANPRYRVVVWVRGTATASDYFEATTEVAFAIDEGPRRPPRVSSRSALAEVSAAPISTVTLSPDLSAPQPSGTTIMWTATATGGGAGREYKWFVYDGNRWRTAAPWSTANAFMWTPVAPNSRYRIAVWARSAASTRDDFEASAEVEFALNE